LIESIRVLKNIQRDVSSKVIFIFTFLR
jgi:hypothetical protein